MELGILALQGAFAEHKRMLESLGVRARFVRTPDELANLQGLILPGGESTVMRRLARLNGLDGALRAFAAVHPVWGICAGMILMAARIEGEGAFLGCLDIAVGRNAYGRQQDSFVQLLGVDGIAEQEVPVAAVFIRAPRIVSHGEAVAILARRGEEAVVVRQGRLLATAFHPELTADTRLHRYFVAMCASDDSIDMQQNLARFKTHDERSPVLAIHKDRDGEVI